MALSFSLNLCYCKTFYINIKTLFQSSFIFTIYYSFFMENRMHFKLHECILCLFQQFINRQKRLMKKKNDNLKSNKIQKSNWMMDHKHWYCIHAKFNFLFPPFCIFLPSSSLLLLCVCYCGYHLHSSSLESNPVWKLEDYVFHHGKK